MRTGLSALVALSITWVFAGPGAHRLGAQAYPSAELRAASGSDQVWYTGRQLRRPVQVQIEGESAQTCGSRAVVFTTDDGEISPSEAVGVWRESRCVAEGWWNLGSNVGLQHATAHLVDAAGSAGSTEAVVFQAIARQGARLFFGGAWTPQEDRWVELVDDGSEPFLREVDPTGIFRPVIGVDFPIWPSWRRIRVAAGAGAREIDRTFYFGVSLLQGLLFGPSQEASAVDLHLGVQLSRRNVGIADPACGPSGLCTRRDLRFSGFTALVTVDGASAFRGLAGAVLR